MTQQPALRLTLIVNERTAEEFATAVLSKNGCLSESEKVTAIRNLLVAADGEAARAIIRRIARKYI